MDGTGKEIAKATQEVAKAAQEAFRVTQRLGEVGRFISLRIESSKVSPQFREAPLTP